MTTKMRSLRNFRNPIGCLILLAALGAAAGCSTAETPSGSATNMNHVLPSGSSVEGWMVVPSGGSHASTATQDYIANGGASGCTECHGSDLSGGISGTSCFGNPAGCHHDPVANWAAPAGARGDRQAGPGQLRVRLLPDLPRERLLRRRGGSGVLRLPRRTARRTRRPVARFRVSPTRDTDPRTRRSARSATSRVPRTTRRTIRPPPPRRDRARMLQQHAVPRRGGRPPCGRGSPCPPAAQPHGNAAKAATGSPVARPATAPTSPGGSRAVSCLNNTGCHGAGVNFATCLRALATTLRTTRIRTRPPQGARGTPRCARSATSTARISDVSAASPPAPASAPPGCFNSTLCHAGARPRTRSRTTTIPTTR